MSIPSEIIALIERLNQELDLIESDATEGANLARAILTLFPDNFIVIQLFAFLNASLILVETSRQQIQILVENLSTTDVNTDEEIQEAVAGLATELGRVIETKIRVSRVKIRLENLQ